MSLGLKIADPGIPGPVDVRKSKYMWLGTGLVFEAFKSFKDTEQGVIQIHLPRTPEARGAPSSSKCTRRHAVGDAGFDATEHQGFRPYESDEAALDAKIRAIFAERDLEGHKKSR